MLWLVALLGCKDAEPVDDSPLPPDSEDTGDTGEPLDPLPRREGVLSLAEADARVVGSAGDALGTTAAGGDGSWILAVGVPQRDGGQGGVVLLTTPPVGEVTADTLASLPGSNTSSFRGVSALAVGEALAVGAIWDGEGGEMAGSVAIWVDPLAGGSPDALWVGLPRDNAGGALGAVGDWTGDGVDDLVAGAIGVDDVNTESGRLSLIDGAMRGTHALEDAEVAVWGLEYGGYLGISVGVGDLDGDGVRDIAVGAMADTGEVATAGAVYVFFGPLRSQVDGRDADGSFLGEESYGQLGKSVSCGGDIDGDGLDDLALGSPEGGDGGFVFLQTAAPLGAVSARDGAQAVISAEAPGDRAGFSVAIVRDRDLDRNDEVLIGAPRNGDAGENAGAAYLFYGAPEGVLGAADADWLLTGDGEGARAGTFVGAAGDWNGDRAPELMVGAYAALDGAGVLYLLY